MTWNIAIIAIIVMIITLIGAVIILLYGGTIGIREAIYRHDHSVCDYYSVQADREVRFATYGYWEWDCLVNTSDGWVSRDNIWSGDR